MFLERETWIRGETLRIRTESFEERAHFQSNDFIIRVAIHALRLRCFSFHRAHTTRLTASPDPFPGAPNPALWHKPSRQELVVYEGIFTVLRTILGRK